MNIGATFKKADLHLHLPGAGQHYDCKEQVSLNTDEERVAYAERFVQQAVAAELSIIAVTCHNDVSWIESVHRAAQRLYGDTLAVFPGVEIGAYSGSDGIHVLALFEIGTSQQNLDEFLLALGLKKNHRFDDAGEPRYTDLSFSQVLEKIDEYEGIAIAPHVFSDNGLLQSERQSLRIEDFTNPQLLAVDLKSRIKELPPKGRAVLENRDPNPGYRRKRRIACLNSSGARTLRDMGKWYTWIKCETINLESLRQAFLDPEARLRLRDDSPPEPRFQIQHVSMKETNSGFLRGLDLSLNPRINCLIGGRGTGKSAIVELLRYVWEQEPVVERQEEIEAFLPVFFPESARVEVDVCTQLPGLDRWAKYRLGRAGRERTVIHQLSGDGTPVLRPDLSPRDIFPLAVFGQKEVLYTLRDIGTQLQMLDRMIGDPLENAESELNEFNLRLRRNRERMIGLLVEISQMEEQTSRLGRIQVRLEQYHQAGLERLEQQRRFYEREAGLWETAENQIAHIDNSLTSTLTSIDMDLSYLDAKQLQVPSSSTGNTRAPHPPLQLPNRESFTALYKKLVGLGDNVRKNLVQSRRQVTLVQEELQDSRAKWQQARHTFNEHYQEQLRKVGGQDFDLDIVLGLEREKVRLERIQRETETLTDRVTRMAQERAELLKQREEMVQRRHDLRAQYARELTERLQPSSEDMPPRVQVRVIRSGDQASLMAQLRQYLTGSRLWNKDYESIAEQAATDMLGFLACVEAADIEITENLQIYSNWSKDGQNQNTHAPLQCLANFCDIDQSKAHKIIGFLTQEQRLEMDEYIVPDRILVEVNIARDVEQNGTVKHKPIWRALGREIGEGVSVGQGCTAILSIIFLETENPLIIDQPEDDLDNRFIYNEIVQVLLRERGQRQMLIATHNANIPVAGDAELIYALGVEQVSQKEPESALRCKVEQAGFIDAPQMRQIVSETLEGGERAFEIRKQKYGF